METSLTHSFLFVGFVLVDTVNSFPIDISSISEGVSNPLWLTNYFVTGFGFCLIIISIIFGCVCCRNSKGFKEFRNSSNNLAVSPPEGCVNPTLSSELTIFPPLGAHANEICRFEPLPNLKFQALNLRPAAFSYTEQEISSQDWFFDLHNNFPRNQLKYVQEYGRGWFGRVVEGEAQNITPEEKVTKVMVKILHEDATPTDHMYFLHEVKFYRDLKHPNILRLLGRCLETEPFLIILECYPNGDLKTFLSQNVPSAQALVEQGITLQMCSNITSGLQFMHDNKFIHTDLAARNCLVGPDLKIKIGDYGNSIEIFKSDYYCAGSVALPVRWCAPETLKCTDITIETREVTPPANIWSLGVVFWEICEFCKLPYFELNDDQVIVRVLGEKNYFLKKPSMICLHKDELYHLMKLCWKSPIQRPTASQINVVLNNLISSNTQAFKDIFNDAKEISQDFEQRWQNLKPNSIPRKDNAIEVDQSVPVDCSIIYSKLKHAKVADSSYVDSPLGIFMSNKNSGQESPRFCLKFDKKTVSKGEKTFSQKRSECYNENRSFKNTETADAPLEKDLVNKPVEKVEFNVTMEQKVSNPVEEVKVTEPEMDSWLKGVEINNEEDESFVRKISEAIRDLDATLAMEKTSSSEENSGNSSRQNSPGKEFKEANDPVVDFKLGNDTSSFINFTQKTFELNSLQNTEQPQSLNFPNPFSSKKGEETDHYATDSLIMPYIQDPFHKCKNEVLDENLKEHDSLVCVQSRNSSDTDDEIWRKRIERGEISEKVKEKSKSIANLMILTHIESDDSDIDLDKPFEKGLNRSSLIRRSGSFAKSSLSSNNFGSENDLTFAVLEDDFKESLKKLRNDHKEHGHFDSLGVILPSLANRENVWESLFRPSEPLHRASNVELSCQTDVNKIAENSESNKFPESNFNEDKIEQNTHNENNFLGNVASEKFINDELSFKEDQKVNEQFAEETGELKGDGCSKGVSVEECSKCDREKCDNSCSYSSQNSSHLDASDVGFDKTKNSGVAEEPFLGSNAKKFTPLVGIQNEAELFEEKDKPTLIDSEVTLFSQGKAVEYSETDSSDSKGNWVSKSLNDSMSCDKEQETSCVKLNETLNESKHNLKEVENVLDSLKSLNYVCDDVGFVPDIVVTEEPNEVLDEFEEEKFEIQKPNLKSFKFVLKDDQEVHGKKENLESKGDSLTFMCDKVFNENDFDKCVSGENTVIVGACEDYTMDYFKGLKTTSEVVNVKSEMVEEVIENENDENLYIWDKHLEKVFTQQLSNTNFDDVSFRSFGLESIEYQDMKTDSLCEQSNNFYDVPCSVRNIIDFIESEKLHTERLEEPFNINRLTNLSVISNDEEYDQFKLRTPDDERSSDSGFRDKGSLSESVEDACDGKYNLEDIEAELEEAFVKGAFGNCETDKEKDSSNIKTCNNFEYEESKFYEDENRNEDDLSDIDGEIEFWHNKDDSDYYPEISEFHPTCSQGWYLHPPDETMLNFGRNVNEDIVNALRNELRESLPVQSRSFDEFNEFYEKDLEDAKRNINIHYISDCSLSLSPILEEQDTSTITLQRNIQNSFLDGGKNANKIKKNIVKLMESVKAVDTTTFMQYLDYMIENEGKDVDEIEEIEEEEVDKSQGNISSPMLILENSKTVKNEYCLNKSLDDDYTEKSVCDSTFEQQNSIEVDEEKVTRGNVLVDMKPIEPEKSKSETLVSNDDLPNQKDECSEDFVDNLEAERLVFTPELLSPDRERSLSEMSRSSNGTRTGDALSEITLSSPDLIPDCFSNSAQEIALQSEANDTKKDFNNKATEKQVCEVILQNTVEGGLEGANKFQAGDNFLNKEPNHSLPDLEKSQMLERKKEEKSKIIHDSIDLDNTFEVNDSYEMSTSFMGTDEDEDTFLNFGNYEQNHFTEEQNPDEKTLKDSVTEDSDTGDWQSDNSEDEESSSSSGEFIWKDGNKESKVKAVCSSDLLFEDTVTNNPLYDRSQNEKSETEVATNLKNKSNSMRKTFGEEENPGEKEEEEEEEEDDNESSTGSSASITDFVPSAWNSQATPTRSALRSADNKTDKQKKSVWFKKQKYHCVYEYPREPSDNEDADGSPYKQSGLDKNISDASVKHFNYGVNTVELPNKHFPYGISKIIDFSLYTDWDVTEGEDPDLSLTDTDSENGTGKFDLNVTKKSDFNFYNLSPFDYDFNTADLNERESEFFVSSSSRPFQGGSSIHFSPRSNQAITNFTNNMESKSDKSDFLNSKEFVTPDSGIDDSTNVTPLDKVDLSQNDVLLKMNSLTSPKAGIIDILDNLKFNLTSNMKENEGRDFYCFGKNAKSKNGFSSSDSPVSLSLPNAGLGELRHTRDKLKLDLPRNHNTELGAIINKKDQ